ncbi:MAG: hypothetical protein AB7P49_20295, partial [Bdellovibrionales bacterium]
AIGLSALLVVGVHPAQGFAARISSSALMEATFATYRRLTPPLISELLRPYVKKNDFPLLQKVRELSAFPKAIFKDGRLYLFHESKRLEVALDPARPGQVRVGKDWVKISHPADLQKDFQTIEKLLARNLQVANFGWWGIESADAAVVIPFALALGLIAGVYAVGAVGTHQMCSHALRMLVCTNNVEDSTVGESCSYAAATWPHVISDAYQNSVGATQFWYSLSKNLKDSLTGPKTKVTNIYPHTLECDGTQPKRLAFRVEPLGIFAAELVTPKGDTLVDSIGMRYLLKGPLVEVADTTKVNPKPDYCAKIGMATSTWVNAEALLPEVTYMLAKAFCSSPEMQQSFREQAERHEPVSNPYDKKSDTGSQPAISQ